jgi:hypothetical protein
LTSKPKINIKNTNAEIRSIPPRTLTNMSRTSRYAE